jgi:endophilin-B
LNYLFIHYSGSTLIKCGQTHQKLGLIYKDFIQSSAMGYMQPLKSFLEGEMKSITVKIYFQQIYFI